ncbi:MAG: hypothetical protein CR997_05460 [Acidobacteria bacterium]|nr:MAG: hypothetical protein CR997_05460 [Acidobacteriota bacterium]
MSYKGKKLLSIILWLASFVAGLAVVMAVIERFLRDKILPAQFWGFFSTRASIFFTLFLFIISVLVVHQALGLRVGITREVLKVLKRTPRWFSVFFNGYLVFFFIYLVDWLVINLSRTLSPSFFQFYYSGTQFFRIWSNLGMQTVLVGALVLFTLTFIFGYLKRPPWERFNQYSDKVNKEKSKAEKKVLRRLEKAERLIEKGRRYRAGRIFESLGPKYAFRAGNLFAQTGRNERSRRCYRVAGAYYQKANCPAKAGEAFFWAEEWEAACSEYEIFMHENEFDETKHSMESVLDRYGEALFQLGRFYEAGLHYFDHGFFMQAASCFEKSGDYDEAGKAYSMAGEHKKSYHLLSEKGIESMADLEKCRWLLQEGKFQEAARCFEEHGFYRDAGRAYEVYGMTLSAANCFYKAKDYSKAVELFIEVGDDERAVDSYEQMGDYKKAAELAAYVGLQGRQAELFLKAGDTISAVRSFILIDDKDGIQRSLNSISDINRKETGKLLEVFKVLIKQKRIAETLHFLEFFLKDKQPNEATAQHFALLADLKKKLGYSASAAELTIKLACSFPGNQEFIDKAIQASRETGIPYEAPTDDTAVLAESDHTDSFSKSKSDADNSTVTQTFDQEFIFDLTSDGKLERFEIISEIGRGGMGVVYKARDRRLNRLVAFKMLHPEYNKDPRVVLFFKRETRFIAQLSHPNIAILHDVGYLKGRFYLVMEYVDGVTLKYLVKKYPKYIRSNFLALWYEAALGLQHAHQMGVLHRDIKPSNIMISKDRHVKVMDFGLTTNAEGTLFGDRVWGSQSFQAPECSENVKASFQSDIYSLGATFYLLATGQTPFKGEDNRMKFEPDALPELPEKLVPGMSQSLSDTIMKCLYRNPEDRYRSVKELLTALKLLGTLKERLFN